MGLRYIDRSLRPPVVIELPHKGWILAERFGSSQSGGVQRAPHSTAIAECRDTFVPFSSQGHQKTRRGLLT